MIQPTSAQILSVGLVILAGSVEAIISRFLRYFSLFEAAHRRGIWPLIVDIEWAQGPAGDSEFR